VSCTSLEGNLIGSILKSNFFVLLLSLFATSLVGCASALVGQQQWIHVKSECKNHVLKRSCVVSNDKGSWRFETPARVLIPRSSKPLAFACESGLVEGGYAPVSAHPSLETLGNLVLGGVVGLAVDIGNDSAFSYPSEVNIVLPICKFL
jgi:hypothetical protein